MIILIDDIICETRILSKHCITWDVLYPRASKHNYGKSFFWWVNQVCGHCQYVKLSEGRCVRWTIKATDHNWLVVYLPLWKIWVRQLGWWWFPIIIWKIKVLFQSPPTSKDLRTRTAETSKKPSMFGNAQFCLDIPPVCWWNSDHPRDCLSE